MRFQRALTYQDTLEMEADAILRQHPKDPVYPAYTEHQLSRHGENHLQGSVDAMDGMLPAARVGLSAADEILFLMSVTNLSRRERICLRAWILGYNQKETGVLCGDTNRVFTQQSVYRWLRSALLKIYDARGISFHAFSRRATYRPPFHRREVVRM